LGLIARIRDGQARLRCAIPLSMVPYAELVQWTHLLKLWAISPAIPQQLRAGQLTGDSDLTVVALLSSLIGGTEATGHEAAAKFQKKTQ
jgi:hypothetical protein